MRFRHIGPVIERSKLHTLRIAENAANGHGRGSSVFPKSPRTNDFMEKGIYNGRMNLCFFILDNGHG